MATTPPSPDKRSINHKTKKDALLAAARKRAAQAAQQKAARQSVAHARNGMEKRAQVTARPGGRANKCTGWVFKGTDLGWSDTGRESAGRDGTITLSSRPVG